MRTKPDVAESVRASLQDLSSIKTPTKATPQTAAAPQPRTTPQTLLTLHRPLLIKIFHLVAPDLQIARNVSYAFRDVTSEYVRGRVKKFREGIEEAECWGGKAPTLADVVFWDPLAVAAVVEDQVGGGWKQQQEADKNGGGDQNGRSEDGELSLGGNSGMKKSKSKLQSPGVIQKRLFTALRSALDNFETGAAPSVRPLCDFIKRHGLHYALSPPEPTDQTIEPSRTTTKQKDQTWLKLQTELYLLSTSTSQIQYLPPLSDLQSPLQTLQTATDISIRSHRSKSLISILTTSTLHPGLYWPILSTALDSLLATVRLQNRPPLSIVLILLDAAFNNPQGPYVVASKLPGWCLGDGEVDGRIPFASELLEKAEECVRCFGLAWHRISSKGEFGVVTASEVAREVKSRTKVM
ncbi:hypothetical protein HK097_008596 [Rhizophlyctis rosea]|uniref:F-box domain-containing protein n=1 Tax=Rhizophlyctis rosea TaxID=64517 RepID=A0AAD5SI70_9FUNG|nr:hypothetical protein HK097_008596 [Rhizophlyctis rosea]